MANYDVTLEVTPTPSAEIQFTTDPGSGVSARNAEAWAVGKRGGVDVESTDITYHNNSKYYAQQASSAGQYAQDAAAAKAAAEAAVAHYPYVDTTTGNWMCWDTTTSAWVNTGVHAQGPTGTVPDLTVGTVTTLAPGSSATVTRRSGSPDEAPVFDFGIPKGDTGSLSNAYGTNIPMSENDSTKLKTAIDGKTNLVSGATSGNFAGLDSSGNLTDSGSKAADFAAVNHTHSEYTEKVQNAVNGNFAGLNASGELTDSGSKASDFAAAVHTHADKADKVSGAVSGNLAGLDGNGNLTDSGKKPSDFSEAKFEGGNIAETGVASFETEGAGVLSWLKAKIVPVQAGSGDPSPSNVRAISGFSGAKISVNGKNLIAPNAITEGQDMTESGEINTSSNSSRTELIPVTGGNTYTMSAIAGAASWTRRIHAYKANGDWIEQVDTIQSTTIGERFSVTFTAPAAAAFVRISFRTSSN